MNWIAPGERRGVSPSQWIAATGRQPSRSLLQLLHRKSAEIVEDCAVAVRIRMKMLGRKHRQFFRIVAIDSRQPRDGRILEELGTYDPTIKNTDERVKLVPDRIKHWLKMGALPSERVAVFLKKYMAKFEQAQ